MTGIFQGFYELLVNMIFGGAENLSQWFYGDFFCQGIATIACVLLIAFPFVIVWRIIKRFV